MPVYFTLEFDSTPVGPEVKMSSRAVSSVLFSVETSKFGNTTNNVLVFHVENPPELRKGEELSVTMRSVAGPLRLLSWKRN
jgi:hypothetical protein